jgi:hypothetical protein
MTTVARLKDGNLYVAGELNERMPPITDGLVAYFPMDGRGGTFDGIGGHQPIQHTTQGVNLIEAMAIDWRDPASWRSNSGMSWDEGMQALRIEGYHCTWLKTPIVVDTTKHYQVSMEVYQEVAPGTGLYLGGLSTNAAGERITPNYDYSYAANANASNGHLPLGEWVTFRVTRYGTGNITSNNSKSFNKIVGWMGTRSGITDLLTKYYYYGGLFNYSSGGVMYIRNLSVVVVDDDDSNMTITNQGVAINESTTNLHDATGIPAGNWSANCGIINSIDIPGFAWAKEILKTGAEGNNAYAILSIPCQANTTYTLSMYARLRRGSHNASQVRLYIIDTANNKPITLTNEFQRFEITATTGADTTTIVRANIWVESGVDADIEIADWQLEAKPYATSFTRGSRTVERLQIPSTDLMPVSEGTVSMWIDVNAAILNKLTNRRIFTHMPSGNPNGFTFRHDVSKGWRFWTGNAAGSGTEIAYPSTSTQLGRHHFALRYAQNELALFIDGAKVASSANPNLPAEYMGPIWIGSYSGGEACSTTFKDLAIYNRALSDREIKQVANQTCSFRPTGDLAVTELREGPMPVPGAPTLFAFDDSLESNNGMQATFTRSSEGIDPSTGKVVPANAPRFTEGPFGKAVLVEEATTNVLDYETSFNVWSSGSSNMASLTTRTGKHSFTVKGTSTVPGAYSYVYPYFATSNTHHSWSCYVTNHNSKALQLNIRIRNDGNGDTLSDNVGGQVEPGATQRLTVTTHTAVSAGKVTPAISLFSDPNDGSVDAEVFMAQLEAKPYVTSFTEGTRAGETLSIPINGTLNPQEGTVECWAYMDVDQFAGLSVMDRWRPVWTTGKGGRVGTYTLHYYQLSQCLEYKIYGSDAAGIVKLPIRHIATGWHHFGCTWDAQGMALRVDGALIGMQATPKLADNFYFDDIYIGNYGPIAQRQLNFPISNLRLHHRALTDEEIANIYKQQMRLLPDKLLLQGQLIEGVVL